MVRGLVGRERALGEIARVLEELGAGGGAMLQLSGEPGIGKTRLLAELAARARERGYLVLEGRAAEFEDHLPFAAFVDALDDHLAALDPRLLERLGPAVLAHLAAVFPAVEALAPAPALSLLDERYRVHRAVRSLLDRLAREMPLVLVIDDVHWLDGASSELLCHLLAHPPAERVLIAIALRPGQVAGRLKAALDRCAAEERIVRIALEPLSRADAARLLEGRLEARALHDAYEECGGNPFYLLELARAGTSGDQPAERTSPGAEVPPVVRSAIEQEIAALGQPARSLVWGAAVAGDPFDAELAAIAAGIPEEQALELLDALLRSDFLRPSGISRRVRFRHPLIRRAVYESTSNGWRITAHRRLAGALAQRGATPTELAHHVEASAEPGDEQAIGLLTAAGAAVAASAPAIAARRFAAALQLLPATDTERRLALLVGLATSLGAAGQLSESRAALIEALALLPPDATGERGRLEAFCAAVEHLMGLHAAAHARLLRALEAQPDRRSADAAALLCELAADGVWGTDWEALRANAAEAAAVAIDAHEPPLQATALALLAFGEYAIGRPGDGIAPLEAAAALVDSSSDAEVATRLDAFYYLAWAEYYLERCDDAIRHADRGLMLARATGQGQFFAPTLTAKAAALRVMGRLEEAADAAQEALDSARLAGHDQVIGFALHLRSWVATAQGDLDLAIATGEEGLAISRRLGQSVLSAAGGWILAEALLEAGEPLRCATIVHEAAGGPDGERLLPGQRCYAWHLLARAAAQRGAAAEAQGWLARLDAAMPALAASSLPTALAEGARAHVLLTGGDPAGAAPAALAAVAAAERVDARLDASRTRLLAARALALAGERDQAIALLERARTEFEHYGAIRYRDRAARDLRRLGQRIASGGRRAAGTAGVAALSERERRIAELVAAGQTNKQIAAELFISAKTVERHLSNAFRKLHVASRAQLAALLARGDDDRAAAR